MPNRIRTTATALFALALTGGLLMLFTLLPRPALAAGNPPNASDLIERAQMDRPLAPAACEPDGVQSSGAVYRICMPPVWNRTLVVYAHGYVDPDRPVAIPEEQLGVAGLFSLPETATLLGYAFAASSYSVNGLAVDEGMADLLDLVQIFTAQHGKPDRVLLIGISEGGLITALSVEQHPDVYDGGLAICGPVGGLPIQTDYFNDFRAVFDYFFPSLLPGSPISIPAGLKADWETIYTNTVRPVILDPVSAVTVSQLLAVTGAAVDAAKPETAEQTIRSLLWYNVSATNDAMIKLGGNPYSNTTRLYSGSADDAALNAGIARFAADPGAVQAMSRLNPSGNLSVPLITAHTTDDPIVPYFHEGIYAKKVADQGKKWLHSNITSQAYGHCTLTFPDLLAAFAELDSRSLRPYRVLIPVVGR